MEQNIHIDQILMEQLVLHRVGNKSMEEGIGVAKKLFNLTDELREVLMTYFIGSF